MNTWWERKTTLGRLMARKCIKVWCRLCVQSSPRSTIRARYPRNETSPNNIALTRWHRPDPVPSSKFSSQEVPHSCQSQVLSLRTRAASNLVSWLRRIIRASEAIQSLTQESTRHLSRKIWQRFSKTSSRSQRKYRATVSSNRRTKKLSRSRLYLVTTGWPSPPLRRTNTHQASLL